MDAGIALTLASLITQGGVIASIFITQRHADRERKEAAKKVEVALGVKADETKGKLDGIHDLVNSRLTIALEENEMLRARLNEGKKKQKHPQSRA